MKGRQLKGEWKVGTGKVFGVVETVSVWVMRLVFLNLLWLFFSLAGLLIAGTAPATAAAFGVMRNWITDEEPVVGPVRLYWRYFKKTFVQANVLWIFIIAAGALIYGNFYFVFRTDTVMTPILLGSGIFVAVMYMILIFFAFPVMAFSGTTAVQSVKYAFIVALSSPLMTFSVFVSFFVIHYLLYQLPGLYLFFSVSAIIWVITIVTEHITSKWRFAGQERLL